MRIRGKIPELELISINTKLRDYYGSMGEGLPRYRVVWANDQFEKKLCTHTPEGLELIHPIVDERPKYYKYWENKYVLEGFTDVPSGTDMLEKYSYEPIFTFEDAHENPLYPDWRVIRIIIETIRHNVEHGVAKYVDPMLEPESAKEEQKKSTDRIYQEYYGNESDKTDSLMLGSGVSLSGPKKES